MSNRKKGVNPSDKNQLLILQAQGFDAEQIASALLVDIKCVKSFMELNETKEVKASGKKKAVLGNKHALDAMRARLKSTGDNSGDIAALREQVQLLTQMVNGQVTKTDGLVDDEGNPIVEGGDGNPVDDDI